MVNKYRDVIRMTLFGRHDKNLNDTTSIYQGYDRYQQTINGGGINSISISPNTYVFTAVPNMYTVNSSNYLIPAITPTISTNYYIKNVTITNAGNYTTGTPNIYLSDTNLGMTITATEVAGYITGFTVTNPGNILFSSAPNVIIIGGGGAGATASCQINANGVLTGLTIINGGTTNTYTTNPAYYFSGGGINFTATVTANAIASITNNNSNFLYTNGTAINMTFYGGGGTGGGAANISLGRLLSTTSVINPSPIGSFLTSPLLSFNGGDINITPQMNGGNTIITGFTITNGGNNFTSPPTIVLSGTGYTTTTCTLTNGVITAIAVPATNNSFTGVPTVSVSGGGLPTGTFNLNPYTITVGGFSPYQNIKRLRFDLSQEFQSIKIANGAVIFLEFIRMPALTGISTCYKNLRVIGAQNITVYDSTQGTTGNPILFTCEGGNTATNYFLSNTEYSRLPVPPNFLNRGYIEFELDTVLTAANNSTVYTAAQLNDLIIKIVIAEPDLSKTQDNNLAPEYNKEDFQIQRVYNKQPLRRK